MPTTSGAGPRRHLLTFKKLVETKDESTGSVTESWVVTDFREYGEIVSGKSDFIFEAQRRNALATWPQYTTSETLIFRIPYRSGIDALKHRIEFEGNLYGIFPPVRDNHRSKMLIQAVLLSTTNVD